jgi:branched-subunit amino acid ABC-type transport system permease component
MSDLLGWIANGFAQGSMIFLIASGLTLIFGVMRVLTFAHGGFFMLGAYLAHQLAGGAVLSGPKFWAVIVCGALGVGVVGIAAEVVLFRRLYALPQLYSLLATYALLLLLQGVATLIWGVGTVSLSVSTRVTHSVSVAGASISLYSISLAVIGIAVALMLSLLVYRTSFGTSLRATAADRQMASVLGINVKFVFSVTFVLGVLLAGLGGGLAAQVYAITPDLAVAQLIQAFAVVVIGGLGSVWGAYVAAIALSTLDAYLVTQYQHLATFSFFAAMAFILLLRPQGLFGRREAGA